jgi:flagellar basal-body rod protein FlgB
MIESLVSSSTVRMLEQSLSFTERRHEVILANIANASVPGYVQQDVSVAGFQRAMRDAADRRRASNNGRFMPESNEDVEFSPYNSQVRVKPRAVQDAMPFHDRGVRSIEGLMGDLADNALAHNVMAQMLRSKYDSVTKAISMKI